MAEEESTQSTPLTRLRSRIMAASYKYQMLGARNTAEEEADPEGSRQRAKQSSTCHLHAALIISCLLLFVLAALLIWQHLYYQSNKQCLTPECVAASAYIREKMALEADPCQDFYRYACGGWEKTTLVPPDKYKYGAFAQVADRASALIKKLLDPATPLSDFGKKSEAVKKARRFYNNCMSVSTINKLGITPALSLIKQLGSWTVTSDAVSGTWDPNTWTLQDALLKSHAIGQAPLFAVTITADDKNSSVNIIAISQSGLTLEDRQEYFANKSETYKQAMLSFATKTGELLGGDNSTAAKMAEVYAFEKSLAQIMVPKENLTDPEKNYHKFTVAEFQKKLGSEIQFKELLYAMFGRDIPDSTPLLCPAPQYFEKLGALLASTSKQVLANYVVWNTLQSIPGYLPESFTEASMELTTAETGVSTLSPRWQRCVSKTLTNMGFAVGALFVQETFPRESRAKVEGILGEIRDSFIHNLASVGWMDRPTQLAAADKASSVGSMIGFPDWISQADKLDSYYTKLEVQDGKFLENFIAANRFELQRILSHLGQPPDRIEWHMSPATVNAYYSPDTNLVVFPAAILQRPFYDPTFPKAFSYGSFGMIAGHELTHGFDNSGRKFDKTGTLRSWWSNSSVQGFQHSTQCMVNQYDQYTVEGVKLHGEYTLGENIADNGGLKIAYQALERRMQRGDESFLPLPALALTQRQLFFVGFAQVWCSYYTPVYARQSIMVDEHSYPKYRVIGTVSNLKEFAEAFSCPRNSPMNPDHKCVVW